MVVIQPLLRGVKKYAWIPFKQVLSVIFWPISVLFYPIKEFYFLMCFIAYVSFASLASISKAVVVFYTTCRIGVLLVMFLCVRALGHTNDFLIQLWRFLDGFLSDDHDVSKRIPIVRRAMAKARSWEEWRRLAQELDRLEKNEEWKAEPTSDLYDHELLTMQVERLKQPRSVSSSDGRKIMFGLQNVFHRKFCQLENSALYTSHLGTKYLIEEFYARTVEQLSYIAKTNFQRSAAVSSSSLPLTSPSPLPPPSQSPLPPAAAASLGSGADAGSNALFSGPPSTGLVSPLSISSPLAATPQQLVPSPSPSSSPSSDLSVVREHDEKEAHCTTTSSTDTDKHDAKNDGVGGEGERNTYSNQLLNNSANIHPQPLGASLSSSGEVRLTDKLRFFQRARKSYGKTVLCLSGGGALTMYHLGVVHALFRANCLPGIISGASGGSIIAGMLSVTTDEELRNGYIRPDLSTRYGVRWLPRLQDQVTHFLRKGVLMNSETFKNTARKYYGDLTFEEAFKKTGRTVVITVTSSVQRRRRGKSHTLILNHITSPRVLIWSAVTCSCSLPGLMEPQELMAKTFDGKIEQYYPSGGTEFVDGSLRADIPLREMAALFNANKFIVSQVNPHVTPFIGSQGEGLQILRNAEKFINADMNHRLLRLSKLKIIPRLYGQDISRMSKQNYTGNITILPSQSFRMQFKVLSHPTEDDLKAFMIGGQRATWPKMSQIQNSMVLERTLEACIRHLSDQLTPARGVQGAGVGGVGGGQPGAGMRGEGREERARPSSPSASLLSSSFITSPPSSIRKPAHSLHRSHSSDRGVEKSFGNTGVGAGVGAGVDAGVDAGVNGGVNGGGVKDGEGHLRQRTTVKGRRRLDHGFSENSRRLSRAVSVSSNISNVSTDLSLSPTFAAAAAPIHVSELQVSGRTVDEIIDSSHTGIIHDAMKKI